jgi:hypothetical protein
MLAIVMTLLLVAPPSSFASSHREAPITALDHTADITDWYAFVSFDHPDRVTMIMNVDPFLEPSNGPNYFPFDPNVLYEMKVDNNRDGIEDITFQFRFKTEIRLPGVFTGFAGGIAGIPPITSLDGPGSTGLSLRQTYTVTMIKNGVATDLTDGQTLFAVPSNVQRASKPSVSAEAGACELGRDLAVPERGVADLIGIDGPVVDVEELLQVSHRVALGGLALVGREPADLTLGVHEVLGDRGRVEQRRPLAVDLLDQRPRERVVDEHREPGLAQALRERLGSVWRGVVDDGNIDGDNVTSRPALGRRRELGHC